MTRNSTPPLPKLLSLSLAFLMAGLVGCAPASEGEQTAGTEAAPQAQAAPATPGAPAVGQTVPAAPATPVDPAKLPAVVAKVNGEEIKKQDLLSEADKLKAQLSQMGRGAETGTDAFYRQVLDGMIARILLQQEAKSQGIVATEEEAKKEIDALRGRFPNPEAFQQALASQGLDEQKLVQEARQQLAVQKLVETKVLSNVTVNDAAAKDFYDKNQQQMKQPERVHARHILIKVDEKAADADKQKARAKADDILARAKKGEDFAKLASENSDDPGSKANGGDLSWFSHGQMVEPFDKAAFALTKPNELSPVVETRFGYHVIQLVERQAESTMPFEQVKARISDFLKQRQSQEAIQGHIQQLRTQGKVETFI